MVTAAEFLVIAIGSRALTFLVLDHYYYGADITVAAVVGLSVVTAHAPTPSSSAPEG